VFEIIGGLLALVLYKTFSANSSTITSRAAKQAA